MTARVAVFPFGGGNVLAHLGSCVALSRELEARGHDVTVAYGGLAAHALEGLRTAFVPQIDPSRLNAGSLAGVLRGPEELAEQVEADVALLRRLRAEVAVVDTRMSSTIACELAGVPFLSVLQYLHATPWRAAESLSSRLRRRDRVRRIAQGIQRRLDPDPLGSVTLATIYEETRRRYGLVPARFYDGDRVACTTTPLLDPSTRLPDHWSYVGPITWSALGDGPPPARGDRPFVYVTQGSTGSRDTLERAVRELAREPVDVFVSTGALADPDAIARLAPNVRAVAFADGDRCMEVADVAVVHGGHLTTVAAHLAGTPVVVVPHGFDQYAWAHRCERLGTGVAVRSPILPGAIRRAVRRTLTQSRYRDAAAAVAAELRSWNGIANAASLVEDLSRAGARPSSPVSSPSSP